MVTLDIHHQTCYRYREPISLGPHRMMLRPRESCELRLIEFEVKTDPVAEIHWAQDVHGNTIATAIFNTPTDSLVIESTSRLRLDAAQWPVFDITASAAAFPFDYSADERLDLGAMLVREYPDPEGRLTAWARAFVRGTPTDTLSLLSDLNAGIQAQIRYQAREAEGTQSPITTLDHRSGSCRDFAVLLVEAVRSLGFGARIVSGYLHNADGTMLGSADDGSTHAWAEVYVPGAGWIAYDPTNLGVGGFSLIPVAVARSIGQTLPVSGSFAGTAEALETMSASVRIEPAVKLD